jgi:hypothetical protein
MTASATGQPAEALDSPQLLIDLDVLDKNLRRMLHGAWVHEKDVRIHFKSLKSAGLARYIDSRVQAEAATLAKEPSTLGHFGSKKWQSDWGCPRRRPINSVHAESWPRSASTPVGGTIRVKE